MVVGIDLKEIILGP